MLRFFEFAPPIERVFRDLKWYYSTEPVFWLLYFFRMWVCALAQTRCLDIAVYSELVFILLVLIQPSNPSAYLFSHSSSYWQLPHGPMRAAQTA